jgi:hypothetical protein
MNKLAGGNHLGSLEKLKGAGERYPAYAAYHLYYPGRRQSSATFGLFVDALRHRN